MSFNIRTISSFDKKLKKLAKKYRTIKDDLITLVTELRKEPNQGVDLGNGVRKVRMAITAKGKGKSHEARVITYTALISVEDGIIFLLTIYDKADRDSIGADEINELLTELKEEWSEDNAL